jgi:hypothetical protein
MQILETCFWLIDRLHCFLFGHAPGPECIMCGKKFVRSQKPRGARGDTANGLALTPYFSDNKKSQIWRKIKERL